MPTTVVSQMGGLGDVVLASRIIASVKEAQRAHTVHLVCREEFLPIVDLFPVKPDRVSGISLNPYHWTTPDADLAALLRRNLKDSVPSADVEMFLAAEYQPTWFSFALAAWLRPQRALAASHIERDSFLAAALCRKLQLDPVSLEGPVTTGDLPELERHSALLHAAGVPMLDPEWKLSAEQTQIAVEHLAKLSLRSHEYLLCFPLGAASIPFKRWPRERFISVLRAQDLPILFTGTCEEEPELQVMAQEIGTNRAKVFVGLPGDLPLLAGLAACARAYLGNDTGTMHLAAAYRVPGVAVFGGGHWPVYAPATAGSVSVVCPLPCFRCDWDCAFGRGLCVEKIPEIAVIEALQSVLLRPPAQPEVLTLTETQSAELSLIGLASTRYREAARERDRRLGWILELQENLRQSESETAKLRVAAEERLEALQGKDQALDSVRLEAERVRIAAEELTDIVDARDSLIDDLEQLAAERLSALEAESAAHRAVLEEAQHRAAALRDMSARMEMLAGECDARLKALEEANARADAIQHEADRREQEMQRMAETIRQQQEAILHLTAECDNRLSFVHEIRTEAERRAAGMIDMAAEIERLSADSNERLQHLGAATLAADAVRKEAELRGQQIVQMTETIRAHETRNLQISQTADEIRLEAERRASQMLEMAALIERLNSECEMRMDSILQLSAALDQSRTEAQRLSAECDARLSALEQAVASNQEIRDEAERRASRMQEMSALIERLSAECDARLQGFERASANEQQLLRQVEQLRTECDARLAALEATDRAASELRVVADDRAAALAQLDAVTAGLRAELQSRDACIAEMNEHVRGLKQLGEDRVQQMRDMADASNLRLRELEDQLAEMGARYQLANEQLIALHKESLYNFLVRRFGGN